jgi:glycosyltransferase involved in cell wall biosynthesis
MSNTSTPLLQNDLLIVLPFRNEKENISKTIDCIKNQKLSNTDRVVLINDHSTDDTLIDVDLPENFILIQLSENDGFGKKSALQKGIKSGKEELILTTDADCLFSENWAKNMRLAINSENQLIIGPLLNEKSFNFITSVQETESIVLLHIAKLSTQLKSPIICWGANLLFTRKAFEAISGYDSHIKKSSGDDVLLLHAIFKKFPDNIFFNHDYEALVTTRSEKDWKSYFIQRMRWASKSAHLKSLKGFLLTLTLLGLLFLPYFLLMKLWFVAVLIPFIEYYFLLKTAHFYRRNFYIGEWFFFRWVYPALVLIIAFLTILPIKINWKGREINY